MNTSRRNFLQLLGLGPLFGLMPAGKLRASNQSFTEKSAGLITLFQGDSITDGNRGRSPDPNHILGHGYAFGIASRLGARFPQRKLSFLNRGTSGDTVDDLIARWKKDTLELRPDVVSLLVGVNDVLHRIKNGKTSEPSSYGNGLRELVSRTRAALPHTRIVLCEPFILPVGMVLDQPDLWNAEIGHAQQVSRQVANEMDCSYVHFQAMFTKAIQRAPAEYWIWDGIHPTYNGHGLMAEEWMKEVGKVVPALRD